jgi:MoaA/NifB/PqqE/SkfB family radical SAM enzyme
VLKLAANIVRSNLGPRRRPYKLTFSLTYRCNSRCLTCNVWQKTDHDELSLEEIDRFFHANPFLQWIDLVGGEIFLREDLREICRSAIQRCPDLFLLHWPTNGLLKKRTVEWTEQVLAMGPKKLIVSVSLDGGAELHDHVRGIPGGFNKTVDTYRQLRAMRSSRFEVYAGLTLSGHNVDHFEAIVEELRDTVPGFEPRDLHVNIAQHSAHFYENLEMDLSFQQKAYEVVRKFRKDKGFHLSPVQLIEDRYLELVPKYIESGVTPIRCEALSSSCFIDPKGDIYPCCTEDIVVGNVRDFGFSLEKAFADERVTGVRDRIREGDCAQCWTPCEAYQTLFAHLPVLLGVRQAQPPRGAKARQAAPAAT